MYIPTQCTHILLDASTTHTAIQIQIPISMEDEESLENNTLENNILIDETTLQDHSMEHKHNIIDAQGNSFAAPTC